MDEKETPWGTFEAGDRGYQTRMHTAPTILQTSGTSLESLGSDELFRRWHGRSDAPARDELVRRFLPLARKLARRYAGAREPIDDLIQVASLGLVKAVDRFDPTREIAFSSFAVPTIAGELKRYFRDLGWSVHVPRGAQEMALKVEQARQQMASRSGRSPSVNELAQYLEWSIDDVLDALEAGSAHHSVSLDAPTDDGEGEVGSLAQLLGEDDERLETIEDRVTIATATRKLPTRERKVLYLRFVEDLTQTQIAELIGVSQMQVSRILRRAVAQLQHLTDAPATG
jgi:RNA polymerase sigma-B factor